MAEGGAVAWGGATESAGGEERRYAALMERLHVHQAERGDHTAHVRLRYFYLFTLKNIMTHKKQVAKLRSSWLATDTYFLYVHTYNLQRHLNNI